MHLTRGGNAQLSVPRRRRSQDRRLPTVLVALCALALSLSLMLAKAPMLSASNGVWVNLDPETAAAALGDSVTLTAQMVDDNGAPAAASAHVRFCTSRPVAQTTSTAPATARTSTAQPIAPVPVRSPTSRPAPGRT